MEDSVEDSVEDPVLSVPADSAAVLPSSEAAVVAATEVSSVEVSAAASVVEVADDAVSDAFSSAWTAEENPVDVFSVDVVSFTAGVLAALSAAASAESVSEIVFWAVSEVTTAEVSAGSAAVLLPLCCVSSWTVDSVPAFCAISTVSALTVVIGIPEFRIIVAAQTRDTSVRWFFLIFSFLPCNLMYNS